MRVTLRDVADLQHGKSKAVRDLRPIFGGWVRPRWCGGCDGLLTSTDVDAGECTQCGTVVPAT